MIYTLGCSFTKWYWPTWSDWLSKYHGPVVNWAHPGYGNQLIYWTLVDQLNRFKKNDHVYIMWSENTRVPQWYDPEWIQRNNCKEFFPQNKLWFSSDDYVGLYRTHPDHQPSLAHMIIDTFKTIHDTQQLLDSIGIDYTMMFMCNPWLDVRPVYKPEFSLQWPKKFEFDITDQQMFEKLSRINPLRVLLSKIKWDKFVEDIDPYQPTSYVGLWEYYLSKKELVLLKHETDAHPNTLAHHNYLIEKIFKEDLITSKYTLLAEKITKESIKVTIPQWSIENFIGSPETEFLDKEKYGL
jgi:hypothetical protein